MMVHLKHIQDSFQQYLLQSDTSVIAPKIVSTEALPAIERLSIYGNAYQSRLVEALASSFPFLHTCLGDDEFYALAATYISQQPSTYRSIRWYGDSFPEFTRQSELYKSLPYIDQIAELDWMMTLVFDSKDADVVTLEQVALISPDVWADMRFVFHPSVHRRQFGWNIVELWQSSLSEDGAVSIVEYPSPVSWLFWRHDLTNHFTSIPEDEAFALDAAMKGLTFSDICEVICQFNDEDTVAFAAASMLKKWIASNFISEISY